MIYLTYEYLADVFDNVTNFKPWIKQNCPSAEFKGTVNPSYNPQIEISIDDFIRNIHNIKLENLLEIKSDFSIQEESKYRIDNFHFNYTEENFKCEFHGKNVMFLNPLKRKATALIK